MSDAITALAVALASGAARVVDLTHRLDPDFPVIVLPPEFGQCARFRMEEVSAYDHRGPARKWHNLTLNEHTGTHFDAPHHWVTGKDYSDGFTDTLDVNRLIAPVNVIDCSKESAADEDFLLTADLVKAWEAEHGEINAGEWVVMRTDWDQRAGDEAKFLNADESGPHSPGPTPDCIEYLLSKKIVGWGSQCIGTDAGQAGAMDPPYPAHNLLHRDNCFGLASLANLDKLPAPENRAWHRLSDPRPCDGSQGLSP